MSSGADAGAPRVSPPAPPPGSTGWRRHQRLALAALAADHAAKRAAGVPSRSWVVLPPGSGKTWVGLAVARDALAAGEAERVVVLAPNTAIQGQWAAAARAFGLEVGTDRSLGTALTALTYQSVAVFRSDDGEPGEPGELDEPGEPDEGEPGGAGDDLVARLHPNGADLVERLATAGPLLLVLDECHHLLDLWGELLVALLDRVPGARVLGLTATPRETLSRAQGAVVDTLFGPVAYAASVPAVVREGDLAPFAETAWFTTPTAAERDWLAEGGLRFAELRALLEDPGFGTTPFRTWLERRFVEPTRAERRVAWSGLALAEPRLADAVLRLVHAGLLDLPEGARPREEHRVPPDVDDWVLLLDDWLRRCVVPSEDPADARVLEVVRRTLPAVGRVWTRNGVRRGRSVVDRVLARSEAKATATVEIVTHEAAELGDRLRLLVLCDHESATATVPMTLRGVVDGRAGSAWAILDRLAADPVTAALGPLLVTARTVAGAPGTVADLAAHVAAHDPDLAATLRVVPVEDGTPEAGSTPLARLVGTTGAWRSRRWVREVTAWFEAGGGRVLVGTKGLLGEGWDARRVTGVVDLTAATTSQSVVQVRGRALRTDPTWPDKVAVSWTVVCLAPEHPQGDADWHRLVRKHTGFLGVDDAGDVVDGVAHLDPLLSPYRPPPVEDLDRLNARARVRAADRAGVRERWRVGEPYDDVVGTAVRLRVHPGAPAGVLPAATGGPGVLVVEPRTPPVLDGDAARDERVALGRDAGAGLVLGGAALGGAALAAGGSETGVLAGAAAGLLAGVGHHVVRRRERSRRREAHARAVLAHARSAPAVHQVAAAVADALHAAGLAPAGAGAVRTSVDPDGTYRARLLHVDEEASRTFATALEEALGPVERPRYLVARRVLGPPPPEGDTRRVLRRAARGEVDHDGEVWHPVPTVLGSNADRAGAYARAWAHWAGGEPQALWTGSPAGTGVLAAQHGSDPFRVSAVLRRHWG